MVVYGFYGLGKSTFCRKHSECCRDLDVHIDGDPLVTEREVRESAGCGGLVFTNCLCVFDIVDIVFIPADVNFVIDRLRHRGGVSDEFIDNFVRVDFETLLCGYRGKVIRLGVDKYISDFEDLLMQDVHYPYFPSMDCD